MMADLIDVLHQMMQDTIKGSTPTDMTMGTVTSVKPLEVKIREEMGVIPQISLRLTAAVIEKKIPVLEHFHTTEGFSHAHALPELSHTHSSEEGETGPALEGSYETEDGLQQDAFDSDRRLLKNEIICYEDGKPLPVKDGYIILNRGLEVGDKVLLLRVMGGEQFIILSRVFEKET